MSVPPPSWVPKSSSTGSPSSAVRSTTAVSNTTTCVRTAGSDASTAPKMPAYTTDVAIDPLWSTQRTTSRRAHLGLQQHLAEVEPLERVLLQHADDRRGEELADIPQPARHVRRRAAEPAAAVLGAARAVLGGRAPAVEGAQGLVHPRVGPA